MVKRKTDITASSVTPLRPRSRSKKHPILSPTKKRQLKRLATTRNIGVPEAIDNVNERSHDVPVCGHQPDTIQNRLQHAEVGNGVGSGVPVDCRNQEQYPHQEVPSADRTSSNVCDLMASQEEHNPPCSDDREKISTNVETDTPGSGQTRLLLQCPSDSTDSGAVDEEYPDPVGATLQQKELRRLARLKQVEEFKAREMAESREERFRRRQSGQAVQLKERHSIVTWKTEDLVTIHTYSPINVDGEELSV